MDKAVIELFIGKEREGSYFTVPFTLPPNVERLSLRYSYLRRGETRDVTTGFVSQPEVNIIDLGLISAAGVEIGASGSDKTEIFVSEVDSTPGYSPCRLEAGEWSILVGAYKVASAGVNLKYELEFTPKRLRLLKGDLHTHTTGSDGVHTVDELAWKAKRNGLDFLAITNHNQMAAANSFPQVDGVTLIPGVEWTHYQGHANFTGVDRPYEKPFATNTDGEALSRFVSARQRGALITINHPFEAGCEFKYDLQVFPFDCIEVWNGPMRESNLRAVGLWHSLLLAGQKIPICGGSDYHRDTPFIFLGGPTTCVYSLSAGPSDILAALKAGHAYIKFSPTGPDVALKAGEALMGDSVAWPELQDIEIEASGLLSGDVLRVVTNGGVEVLLQAPTDGYFHTTYKMKAPGFARVEVLRVFIPGVPLLPALISNPIYFDGKLNG